MLKVANLSVAYGSIKALHDVSLHVPEGSIVTLIGANGAGKSTTLRAISGLVKSSGGSIRYAGGEIARLSPHLIVGRGLCHVPEGRMVFANLTVRENLKMGAYLQRDKTWIAAQMDYVCQLFPRLLERESQAAGTLSGGEQQMLAMARAVMLRPDVILLDEPSMGLAPILVDEVFRIIRHLKSQHVTMLLVEQFAAAALDVSDYAYVLESGRIALEGPAAQLKGDPAVRAAYLGRSH